MPLPSSLARAALLSFAFLLARPAFADDAAVLAKDLPYKSGDSLTEYEKERCKLDLFAPGGAKGLPCVVWFHGGGLTGGNKNGNTAHALAEAGMLVAAVNYRLSPKATYPAYIDDAAAAVAWMLQHAAEYGGDPHRLFVAGHSAGGYLTAMVVMDKSALGKYGVTPDQLAGAIPVSGQMMTHYTIREERGVPKEKIIADDAAPISHARKETPPLLVLYGENDMALRGDENRYFAAALKAAGNRNVTLTEIPAHDHGTMGSGLAKAGDPVREAFVAFVKEHGPVASSVASQQKAQ